MTKNVLMLRPKLYHRGSLVDNNGKVSALCFATPRPIDLGRAMWTNRDEAVTCPKCLRLLKQKATIQPREGT